MPENSSKDKLSKLLMEFQIAANTNVKPIENYEEAIKLGFEQNPDVFSIVGYLSTILASVPKKPYRKLADGKLEEITDSEIIKLINKPNPTETQSYYDKLRYSFYLITGNMFEYCPRLEAGNNKGQLMPGIGRKVAPSQYIEIISGGWKEPVKEYIINFNYSQQDNIKASEMIHVKNINLNYNNGNQLYGISPISVAASIIQAQNGGYTAMASTMQRGFPSGILTRKGDVDTDPATAQNRINVFKKLWNKYYAKSKNSGSPIITAGDVAWIEMGFRNFKELAIVENSQHGMRVLCNVFGIPSMVLNDIAGTTFNNQKEVRKSVYTNKIMPDLQMICESDNANIWINYGFEVWPDYTGIPELQADKKELADVINVAQNAGAMFTGNEVRTMLDMETVDDPLLDERYTTMGRVPASMDIADTTLKSIGLNHYVS